MGAASPQQQIAKLFGALSLIVNIRHWPIMEALTDYIRENTVENTKEKCNKKIKADIQVALTVISRRSKTHRKKEKEDNRSLNLRDTCLYRADLRKEYLEFADLQGANLEHTNLRKANLQRANLCGTKAASARDLTQEQIDTTFGDKATTLPEGLARPEHWSDKEFYFIDALSEWKKWLESQRSQSQEEHSSRRP